MSTKKIAAGDTLTVGDLTDDHMGAEIEFGPIEGMRTRMTLDRIEEAYTDVLRLFTPEGGHRAVRGSRPVTIITPPPVVQPDEPTILGQCIRIEGDDEFRGVVANPGSDVPILIHRGGWCGLEAVLLRAGDRQIIVSDPPRWPDETPELPERIEVGEWPDDDTHLREWEWVDRDGALWRWDTEKGGWVWYVESYTRPLEGPWTRGERVK